MEVLSNININTTSKGGLKMKITGTNVSMIRGDSESFTVSMKKNGVDIPFISGDTVYLTIKKNIYIDEILVSKAITEFTDGKAIIEIKHEDTMSLEFKPYVYDIQFSGLDGTVTTLVPMSNFIIGGEVTCV